MISKSLNYAYPRKYAEGGDVAPDTRRRLEFTPSDDSGNSFRYVLYDDKGREAQSGVTQRKYVESGLFGPGTDEKYNVSFLEQAPAPLPPEPEQKSTSYAFVDADGNSYSMGDARPGHDGTSLERAIANVQEYYDFAPGSFTVSVPSEKRLVGTYDSDSGSFQAATSDMRDLNEFSPTIEVTTQAMGEEDAPFAEPTIEEIKDLLGPLPDPIATMAMGEEAGTGYVDGGRLMPPPGTATTLAMGEEDGGGLMPPFSPDMVTTMAIGEEDGGMPPFPGVDLRSPVPDAPGVDFTLPVRNAPGFSLPPGVDPMFPAPVVNPVFTPSPVVNPVFTPSPDNTAFTPPPPPPVEGRTYGAYSGTPMGPTNSIQPFTPYMAPQPAQGPDLQSLITDTDYFLNNSGPRTSIFQRS
jgi:hypothetical protein